MKTPRTQPPARRDRRGAEHPHPAPDDGDFARLMTRLVAHVRPRTVVALEFNRLVRHADHVALVLDAFDGRGERADRRGGSSDGRQR